MDRFMRMVVMGMVAACMLGSAVLAQADMMDKVDIVAIKKMNVEKVGEEFMLNLTIIFSNKNEADLKIKDGSFETTIITDDGQKVPLGTGTPAMIELPKQTEEIPSQMKITLGPDAADTHARMVMLFNVLGDPDIRFSLSLDGKAKVGRVSEKGVVYSDLEVELKFKPKVAREVLF